MEFIINKEGERAKVILSIKQYNKLMDKLEDLEDLVASYESEREPGEAVTLEEYAKQINFTLPNALLKKKNAA